MIISHKHRFIFFAVPKTATHTIREALRKNLGPDDWEQQFLMGEQCLPIPEIAKFRHGHISTQQIRPYLPEEMWTDYFKFAFVRNPFDRYISTCFFLNRGDPNFGAKADSFMKKALSVPKFQRRVLVTPQYLQLTDADADIELDFVGRYEFLQDSYDDICSKIGVPSSDLGVKNASDHATFTSYYDDELRTIVGDFYDGDLRLFNYKFPESAER